MPNRHASWWLAFLLAGCQSTCNPPPPMDAGMDASAPDSGADAGDDAAMTEAGIDSGMDAAVDSGMDAAVDASVDASTDAATDSAVDATIDATIDATVDAPTCPSPCRGSGECVTAACVGTACVETPVMDGTTCGELMGGVVTHLCVAGACVLRGCGDGYREPGPSPMREACDDGNASELDACSTACEPQILDLDVPPDTSYEAALGAGAASVAQSGSGPLLFVWLRDRFDRAEVVARRYSPEGVARPLAEDPLVLDDMASAFDASPSVAPLPGAAGWVVVWVARRADHARVLYRILSRAGFLGAERVADDEPTNQAAEPRVAALSSGFVIAWTATRAASTDPNGGVRARVFDAMGAPTGPSFLPASDVSQREDSPTLASDADEWLLVYASSSLAPGAAPQLFARRFDGAMALDASSLPVGAAGDHAPAATSLGLTATGARYALGFVRGGELMLTELAPGAVAVDPPHALAPMGSGDRAAPALARYGTGMLVAFEQGFPSRLALLPDMTTLPPERSILEADWSGSAEGPVSARATTGGTWLVWAGSEGPTRVRALRAFRMGAP